MQMHSGPMMFETTTIPHSFENNNLILSSDFVEKEIAKFLYPDEKESILQNSIHLDYNVPIPKELTVWQGMRPNFNKLISSNFEFARI